MLETKFREGPWADYAISNFEVAAPYVMKNNLLYS